MGLFDKKFCDICGDKVNLLTQKKLSDGQLCRQIKQDGASVNQGYSQMNQSYGQPQQNMGGFAGNTVQNVAYTAAASAQVQNNAYNNAAPVTPQTVDASWICSSCGTRNEGKFCQGCGCAKPVAMPSRCPSCGWTPANGQPMPKFFPECCYYL